ncbi:MAG: tyrosine-type recombinase/integrase [Dactylosporangium sp.]|nr:tyrosine-type recombinase/integrase [Dactylosporangium sp.]NNJ61527.1 tyrosine-type recombinase/integrase [Dactylosporangium sp.]
MGNSGSDLHVVVTGDGHRLVGGVGDDVAFANRFLQHLSVRQFAAATVRAYAYDLLNFLRFLSGRHATLADVVATDLFDYLEWQSRPVESRSRVVVRLDRRRGAAPATMNRRVAAVRGLFEYAVMSGLRTESPVPTARRSSGLRAVKRGMLGHVDSGRSTGGGQLVRTQRRLPESLDPGEVAAFTVSLATCRDRAMVLLMLLGGLRSAEIRGLRLADVDMGLRRVRVLGKGGRERVVPVDPAFFAELAAYLRTERPKECRTPECFVVLRGATAGHAMTEAGLRRVFRTHRGNPGAGRVRPHRLRHTYGTGLADAGIDLLVLRDLMGHASPETTAGYVHLSASSLAREYTTARAAMDR